ncbi:MAG: sugar transferase [Iphinoe sp. HA4291-MV1]|jgi:lipopolysaccharide/colanic/teichoic acid biosynthesis glycosyltransferase|nr:sugar transferase [Iphinoe sp. HA4291-MV1]
MFAQQFQNVRLTKHSRLIKFVLDRFVAAIALLVFSPVMLVLAIAVYFQIGRPIFYTEARPGKGSHIFKFYKFRSMTNNRDSQGKLLPDDQRITAVGYFLRKTSLDELPQLWNVLKGEMSFVGPRPLHARYLERYTPEQARRHEVKPGITGWAQINGRNSISWEKKFQLDVWYVDHWSLWLDLKILILTIWKVIKKEGISQQGYIAMEEFRGTQTESLNDRT